MSEQRDNRGEDDAGIEELLRAVGTRDLPAPEVMAQVRDAVHGEWRGMVRQRARRKRIIGYAAAASVLAVAAVAFTALQIAQPAVTMAQVDRVAGVLEVDPAGFGDWRPLAPGENVKTGDTLRTDAGSSAALDFGNGVSVRVDAGSLIEVTAADRLALDHGAIYVDADPRSGATKPLIVQTPYGSVRHLGTQYQIRASRNGIEVSVREGRVEIENAAGTQVGAAGEQLRVASAGEFSRGAIAAHDPAWQWATRIAPVLDIDHQPLSVFLEWVARETGKELVYATPQLQAQAAQLVLRGSVTELSPEQALAAVLAPTAFAYRETGTRIEIQSR